jgi:hypothetical protein
MTTIDATQTQLKRQETELREMMQWQGRAGM